MRKDDLSPTFGGRFFRPRIDLGSFPTLWVGITTPRNLLKGIVCRQDTDPPTPASFVRQPRAFLSREAAVLTSRFPHSHGRVCQAQVALSLQLESRTPPRERHPGAGRLISAARQAWALDSGDLSTKRTSHLHREIAATLHQMGIPAQQEVNLSG